MAETFEEQYLDVLQNIEFAIVEVYRASPTLTDWNTEKVIKGLIRGYQAEAREGALHLQNSPTLTGIVAARKSTCDWRLGHETMVVGGVGSQVEEDKASPITLEEIVACLKRIRLSIKPSKCAAKRTSMRRLMP